MPDLPTIDVTPERVACSRHGEPFRETWPLGFPSFAIALFDEYEAAITDRQASQAEAELIMAELDEQPLCERVSRATLMRLYIVSGVGTEATCELCHKQSLGTVYTTRLPNGTTQRFEHLCFDCLFDLQPAN